MEGATKDNQAAFMSEDYLRDAKVALKRIEIPQRQVSTGRMWWSEKWIPTMRVIVVNRTPVTREWTVDSNTGTSTKNEALATSSKESIPFYVGLTITASILEEDAPRFLYRYAGSSLADVLDNNVRGTTLAKLSDNFGKLTVDQCRLNKSEIVGKIFQEVSLKYKEEGGITIDAMGTSGSLVFLDENIQTRVNAVFIAEQNIQVQMNEKLAQEETNKKVKSIAETRLYEAQKFAAAQNATNDMVKLEIQKMGAQAMLNVSEGMRDGKLQLPSNMLPIGSQLLFGIDSKPAQK